jgi:hypothetical protein
VVTGSQWVSDRVRKRGHYPAQGQVFGDFLGRLWATACHVLAVPVEQAVRSAKELRAALPAWAGERIGSTPVRPSYVADDGFPAEMSVNWSGSRPELRMLFDSLESTATSPRRWGHIHDIFTRQAGRPSSAPVWHAVAWRPPAKMAHKTYFGLYAWPPAQRYAAVGEAMRRLGLAAAWDHARTRVEKGGGDREIEFFAVDLADEAGSRVKVYYRNHGADIDEMNRIASVALDHDADTALAAYRTLTGKRTYAGDAALSCLAFRTGLDHAAECATYLRLPSLTSGDDEGVDRTAALLRSENVDPHPFRSLATELTSGPLEDSQGFLELVSHRAARRRGDITTYFRLPVYHRPASRPVSPVDRA